MALRLLMIILVSFAVAACGDDDVDDTAATVDETDTAEGPCGWLTTGDISDVTGLELVTTTPGPDGCTWGLTESAAVIDGPNEGEEAVLETTMIDLTAFDAARDDAAESDTVDVGDEAFMRFADDESNTRIYVRDGDAAFTMRLAGALDGRNANTNALVSLSSLIVERN